MILIAETIYGALRGVKKQDYSVFRGIPYADAPLGVFRWCKPHPPLAWKGLRQAAAFAPRCIQAGQEDGSLYQKEFFNDEDFLPPMSEDCLYLNIWTPAGSETDKLPVAFWIHGGAFMQGFNSEIEFDGEAFARQGVILVTVSYRLGALGFLTHPLLWDQDGLSGNYALYDLIAALDWVRTNIGAFGGNKDNITVFGQSAGAMAAQALVSSSLTVGKIHRAILQSGGGYKNIFTHYVPVEKMEQWGEVFIEAAGISTAEELRSLTVEKILEIQTAIFQETMREGVPKNGLPFAPYNDGVILKGEANELLEKGTHLDIPYMLGSTESDLGVVQGKDPKECALYQGCTAYSVLNEQLGRKPAWVYYFTQCPQGDGAGAFHSAELWYMFGTLGRNWRPKTAGDWELSSRMVLYWCNFIKSGDPNGGTLSQWNPYKRENPFVMELHG
jgi:para-nitrobenzyl esterase